MHPAAAATWRCSMKQAEDSVQQCSPVTDTFPMRREVVQAVQALADECEVPSPMRGQFVL